MALYRSVAAGLLGTVCYVTTDMRNNSRAKDTDNLNPKSSYFSKPIDIQTRYSSHEASLMYLTMANPEITVDDLQQDRAVVAKQMAHKRRNCNFEYAPIVIHTRTTEQPTHPHYKRTTAPATAATAPQENRRPLGGCCPVVKHRHLCSEVFGPDTVRKPRKKIEETTVGYVRVITKPSYLSASSGRRKKTFLIGQEVFPQQKKNTKRLGYESVGNSKYRQTRLKHQCYSF